MAVKTITIDTEAYSRLKKAQKANESFSQTIKRVVPERVDLEAFLKKVDRAPFSPEFVEAVEEQIANRRHPRNRRRR